MEERDGDKQELVRELTGQEEPGPNKYSRRNMMSATAAGAVGGVGLKTLLDRLTAPEPVVLPAVPLIRETPPAVVADRFGAAVEKAIEQEGLAVEGPLSLKVQSHGYPHLVMSDLPEGSVVALFSQGMPFKAGDAGLILSGQQVVDETGSVNLEMNNKDHYDGSTELDGIFDEVFAGEWMSYEGGTVIAASPEVWAKLEKRFKPLETTGGVKTYLPLDVLKELERDAENQEGLAEELILFLNGVLVPWLPDFVQSADFVTHFGSPREDGTPHYELVASRIQMDDIEIFFSRAEVMLLYPGSAFLPEENKSVRFWKYDFDDYAHLARGAGLSPSVAIRHLTQTLLYRDGHPGAWFMRKLLKRHAELTNRPGSYLYDEEMEMLTRLGAPSKDDLIGYIQLLDRIKLTTDGQRALRQALKELLLAYGPSSMRLGDFVSDTFRISDVTVHKAPPSLNQARKKNVGQEESSAVAEEPILVRVNAEAFREQFLKSVKSLWQSEANSLLEEHPNAQVVVFNPVTFDVSDGASDQIDQLESEPSEDDLATPSLYQRGNLDLEEPGEIIVHDSSKESIPTRVLKAAGITIDLGTQNVTSMIDLLKLLMPGDWPEGENQEIFGVIELDGGRRTAIFV